MCMFYVGELAAVYIRRPFITHKKHQLSSASSLSPLLVTQRHHQLQCYRECITTTSCEAFTETNTQCSLYGATVNDEDVEASTDIDLYMMGKKLTAKNYKSCACFLDYFCILSYVRHAADNRLHAV